MLEEEPLWKMFNQRTGAMTDHYRDGLTENLKSHAALACSVKRTRRIGYLSGEFMSEINGPDQTPGAEVGSSEVPEMNLELATDVLEIVGRLAGDIFEIDQQLLKCKRALALLQPMKDGRIDLRFWSKHTIPGRHPAPLRWRKLPAGLHPAKRGEKQRRPVPGIFQERRMWTAEKISVKRLSMQARRSRGFGATHQWVVEVLDLTQELMEVRAVLLEQLSALRWYERRWGQTRRARVMEIGILLDRKMKGYEAVAEKMKELDAQEKEEARKLIEEANEAERRRTWVIRGKANPQ